MEDDRPTIIVNPPSRTGKKTKKKTVIIPVPMPSTVTQARNLLKQKAHVNINDYLSTRKSPFRTGFDLIYPGLIYVSAAAMVNYTVQTENYTPKKLAKDEWLQPLMRDMGASECTVRVL